VSDSKLEQGRLGVEKGSFFLRVKDYEGLRSALPHAAFIDGTGIVEPHRAIKSPEEIAYIRAAARVFHRRGFAGAGMREIAGEADLSPGNLYHYFKGKDELLYFCQDRSLDVMLGAVTLMSWKL